MNCLLVFVIAFISVFVWWYYVYFKYNRYLEKYKGPPILPFVGSLHKVGSAENFITNIMKMQKQYGLTLKMWFGNQPRLIVSDYRVAELVLGTTAMLAKGSNYSFLHAWLGTGLLTSSGTKWKQHRKLLTPAFHFKILDQFIGIFHTQSNILIEKIQNKANQKPFDVFPYVNLCALDIICEATMGTQVNAQKDWDSVYVNAVAQMCKIVLTRTISPLKTINLLYRLSSTFRVEQKMISILHGYTNAVIKSRRKEITRKTLNEDEVNLKKGVAFLDLLIRCKVDGAALSDDVIRQEVDTFMFEGHDTTTSAISFALYCLSIHQNVQNKVVKEIHSILGTDPSDPPTYQNLVDMKYLEMVIKESLRLYPSVPFYGRVVEENIQFDGSVLPKGVNITIAAFGLHRQEEVYPEPEKFDPERFTGANMSKRSPFSYVPFSAGPRNCIGQRFAMLEVKSVISKILRKFEILPVPNYKPILTHQLILKSLNGVQICLKNRY